MSCAHRHEHQSGHQYLDVGRADRLFGLRIDDLDLIDLRHASHAQVVGIDERDFLESRRLERRLRLRCCRRRQVGSDLHQLRASLGHLQRGCARAIIVVRCLGRRQGQQQQENAGSSTTRERRPADATLCLALSLPEPISTRCTSFGSVKMKSSDDDAAVLSDATKKGLFENSSSRSRT